MTNISLKLSEVCSIWREIEELQEKIDKIYTETKAELDAKKYDDERDEEEDKQYLDCIKSYSKL